MIAASARFTKCKYAVLCTVPVPSVRVAETETCAAEEAAKKREERRRVTARRERQLRIFMESLFAAVLRTRIPESVSLCSIRYIDGNYGDVVV